MSSTSVGRGLSSFDPCRSCVGEIAHPALSDHASQPSLSPCWIPRHGNRLARCWRADPALGFDWSSAPCLIVRLAPFVPAPQRERPAAGLDPARMGGVHDRRGQSLGAIVFAGWGSRWSSSPCCRLFPDIPYRRSGGVALTLFTLARVADLSGGGDRRPVGLQTAWDGSPGQFLAPLRLRSSPAYCSVRRSCRC